MMSYGLKLRSADSLRNEQWRSWSKLGCIGLATIGNEDRFGSLNLETLPRTFFLVKITAMTISRRTPTAAPMIAPVAPELELADAAGGGTVGGVATNMIVAVTPAATETESRMNTISKVSPVATTGRNGIREWHVLLMPEKNMRGALEVLPS